MTDDDELTIDEQRKMRLTIGEAVLTVQRRLAPIYPPETILPEILATLLSLSLYISRNNLKMADEGFLEACKLIAKEEAPDG